jgi:hypothetical protein
MREHGGKPFEHRGSRSQHAHKMAQTRDAQV